MYKPLLALFTMTALLSGCATPKSKDTAESEDNHEHSASVSTYVWKQQYDFQAESLSSVGWTHNEKLNGWYRYYNKPKTACILNVVNGEYGLLWSELDKTKSREDVEKIVMPRIKDYQTTVQLKTKGGLVPFYVARSILSNGIIDSFYAGDFENKKITLFSLTCDFDNKKETTRQNLISMDTVVNDLLSRSLLEKL